ncbi:MAG: YqjK-like family protein [Zoogloeaceae bacterium]|nr:YqjK-like family protein [Zoogloeaceae bacterium]
MTYYGRSAEHVCQGIDSARSGVRWVKHHPVAVGIACAALVILRPRRAWRFARRTFLLVNGWQMLRRRLEKMLRPVAAG